MPKPCVKREKKVKTLYGKFKAVEAEEMERIIMAGRAARAYLAVHGTSYFAAGRRERRKERQRESRCGEGRVKTNGSHGSVVESRWELRTEDTQGW